MLYTASAMTGCPCRFRMSTLLRASQNGRRALWPPRTRALGTPGLRARAIIGKELSDVSQVSPNWPSTSHALRRPGVDRLNRDLTLGVLTPIDGPGSVCPGREADR